MMHNQLLHQRQAPKLEAVRSHEDLKRAQRIVVKAGTSMVIGDDGCPCLPRVSRIIEEITHLRRQGRDVIFVCSGAVGVGRNTIRRQQILGTSAFDRLSSPATQTGGLMAELPTSAFAAAGQASLMRLLQVLFSQLDVSVAELLLTRYDFETKDRKESLTSALETLLMHGIVPIINENDAVSAGYAKSPEDPFKDNDGLAALVAAQTNADFLLLLTNVDGLYDRPPSDPEAKLISVYDQESVEFGPKSSVGRGGMSAKIASACRAVEMGVPAVCISNGERPRCITECLEGKPVGTLVVDKPSEFHGANAEEQAIGARQGSAALAALSGEERGEIIRAVANALNDRRAEILKANAIDVERAERAEIAPPLLKRLALTENKLNTLIDGIRSLADVEDPIGHIKSRTEISEGVELVKQTTPIGVLLIIFESRPDSLPQIAALSLRSGNGLLLKGGKEAEKSNACLHRIIVDAVHQASGGKVPKSVIGLVTGRAEIEGLLKLDKHIDLVIPRGSGALVKHIQRSTNIPVLGHAEGICHTFIHRDCDVQKAAKIVVDAKVNYPAACNATETLLLDEALCRDGARNGSPGPAREIVSALESAGVIVYGGPNALSYQLVPPSMEAKNFKTEYGDNRITLEVVPDTEAAIAHINKYGSHHTDSIITENKMVAEAFIQAVDSACVFHNCSTRMADGYRMGLGAEVGISTGRIHARGPVGVEGLLTDKWIMRSKAECTTATNYADGHAKFTHKVLPVMPASS